MGISTMRNIGKFLLILFLFWGCLCYADDKSKNQLSSILTPTGKVIKSAKEYLLTKFKDTNFKFRIVGIGLIRPADTLCLQNMDEKSRKNISLKKYVYFVILGDGDTSAPEGSEVLLIDTETYKILYYGGITL